MAYDTGNNGPDNPVHHSPAHRGQVDSPHNTPHHRSESALTNTPKPPILPATNNLFRINGPRSTYLPEKSFIKVTGLLVYNFRTAFI